MRRYKYLIGALIGVIGALNFSSLASSDPTGLTLQTTYPQSKQDKKKYGGVSLQQHQGFAYDAFVRSRGPRQMVFTLPRDAKFVPGNLPVCPLSQVEHKLDSEARARCSKSIIGQGSIENNGGALKGTLTFFRGDPALNQDLIVHVVVEGNVLVVDTFGDISGGGRTLTFGNMPHTPGNVLTAIDTTFFKRKTGESTSFLMARCGKKREWTTTLTTAFYSGESLSTTSTQRCRQKRTRK